MYITRASAQFNINKGADMKNVAFPNIIVLFKCHMFYMGIKAILRTAQAQTDIRRMPLLKPHGWYVINIEHPFRAFRLEKIKYCSAV